LQIRITGAGLAEEASAIGFGAIEHRLKDQPDALPPVRFTVHDASWSMSSLTRATDEPLLIEPPDPLVN
jgi:hypothetical protein